jgi:hypothetical protein
MLRFELKRGQTGGPLMIWELSASRFFIVSTGRKLFALSRGWSRLATAFFAFAAITSSTSIALADEDGISFWIPGFFGSLAAVPQQPGWSLTTIYYHDGVSASGNAAVAREIRLGQFNPTINVNVSANVHAIADLGFVIPTYVFATPFLGGQASASLLMGYGNNNTSLNATATVTPGPLMKSVALQQRHDGLCGSHSNVRRSLECRCQQLHGLSDR